jgi:hypothetical protein
MNFSLLLNLREDEEIIRRFVHEVIFSWGGGKENPIIGGNEWGSLS